MGQPLAEPPHLPPATEQQVRSRAAELVALALRHGIAHLAFASSGRLRGHVADDRDLFDMFEFQRDATNLLGAEITSGTPGIISPNRRPAQRRQGGQIHHRRPLPVDTAPAVDRSRERSPGLVRRFTWARLDSLQATTRHHLRTRS
jgi:hypothetical protein